MGIRNSHKQRTGIASKQGKDTEKVSYDVGKEGRKKGTTVRGKVSRGKHEVINEIGVVVCGSGTINADEENT